ncbi:sensor histidine kinase [Streptomyces sp. NPDC018031]|uniref:sensor histidine kinase n=1 Tax=Streptomyces sp. NPDC018031 TaxID=3365033 RepID=UPI00379AE279
MRQIHAVLQCLLTGCVLTVLLVCTGCLYAQQARHDAVAELDAVAGSLARGLTGPMSGGDRATAERRIAEAVGEGPLKVYARWPDGSVTGVSAGPDGAVRTTRGHARREGLPRAHHGSALLPALGEQLCAEEVVPARGPRAGALLVQRPATGLRGRILTAWTVLGLLLPVATAVCVLPVLLARRRTLRALDRIGDTLHAMAEGAFHARADAAGAGGELGRLVAQVNWLAAVVQSAMEEQRSFLADVAHQLRNPMVALRLRIENIRPLLPRSAGERHARLLADVDRMDRTLTEMLDHARGGPVDRAAHITDVCGVVEECVRGWASVAQQRAIRLKLARPRHAWALTRPGAVEQALHVLLDNALKYSPEGGVIEVGITVDGPQVRVRVCDEGPGLPDFEREAALERGWRRGPYPGSGLGLSIAAKLLDSAGGRLELRPGEGRGLSAVLRLPGALPGEAARGRDRGRPAVSPS